MNTARFTGTRTRNSTRKNTLHRALRRSLAGLTLAAATAASLATPVTVSISGLPPGLQPVLQTMRNVCPDGMGWARNAPQALTEQTSTVFERVTLPGSKVQFRPRIVTRYVAQFDTPATTNTRSPAWEVQCSATGMNDDWFQFSVDVPGTDAQGRPQVQTVSLGQTPQRGPLVLQQTLAARTTSISLSTPAQDLLPRGMLHTVRMGLSVSSGTVQQASLDLLRPVPSNPQLRVAVARLFQRANGTACIQAGGNTRCLGDTPGPLMHGGLVLHAMSSNQRQATVQFTLMQDFPAGALTLRSSADASDLPFYLVDGVPTPMDLLPWTGLDQAVTVQ